MKLSVKAASFAAAALFAATLSAAPVVSITPVPQSDDTNHWWQKRFVEKFEALRCQDLLQKQFAPDERTPAAVAMGITGHCSVMIVTAVEIIEAMLEEQNENR